MAKGTSGNNGATVLDSESIASLKAQAESGDPAAALELYNATRTRKGKNPDYKYDPRTATATDAVSGDQFGVVTWMPNDSDTKYHYVIRIDGTTGRVEVIHNANGKPLTLGQASDMKTFISAMQMANVIR